MSPGILGKKIGMSQVFRPDGQAVPVTLLKAGPCVVVQRKTPTTDGYNAVQLGLVEFAKAPEAPALTSDELARVDHLYAANFGLEPEEPKFKGTMELPQETAAA